MGTGEDGGFFIFCCFSSFFIGERMYRGKIQDILYFLLFKFLYRGKNVLGERFRILPKIVT